MQYRKSGYLSALRIIHLALLTGQCIMLGIVLFLVIEKKMPPADRSLDKILQVTALAVTFGGVYGAIITAKKRLLQINSSDMSLAEKADQYRITNIIQWALLEGASLFSIICFLLTGNYAFGALAAVLIAFFVLLGPSRLKIMLQLQLTDQEVDSLQ